MDTGKLQDLTKLIRYFILVSTTEAGSGHPTSSLSAVDLMTVLFFGGFFRFKLDDSQFPNNDRLIFSKGHASPLYYSLYAAAGVLSEEDLKQLRKFDSNLEGHPTMRFPFTEAATGSLGQGLSIGVGMALNAKYIDKLPYRTYVLLGDSEMVEGSVWEAMAIAAHYKLNNLIAIVDVNRLGQRGETMYGHDVESYAKKAEAFGWVTRIIDGHNLEEIKGAYDFGQSSTDKPVMIVAKTLKGKGISFLEDKDGWHGKAISKDELEKALTELGDVNTALRGGLNKPEEIVIPTEVEESQFKKVRDYNASAEISDYKKDEKVATRKAYGTALARIYPQFPNMVVLDAEVSNSTYAEIFKKEYPDRFFEMFIAEQNMAGAALGFSRRGKIPFVSTFAAFFSRAYDQIRMSQYSNGNIKFVGSHVGVSIGEDGSSQMGLEDIAMFRTLLNSVVFYPSDAIATEKLVALAAAHRGNVYLRTTRAETPILYKNDEEFRIGGSKVHGVEDNYEVVIVSAGITLFEALKAQEELAKEKTGIVVIDAYSIKPIDAETLMSVAKKAKAVVTVEDHFPEGGLGEAVKDALSETGVKVVSLAVRKMPRSGKPAELLSYEEIDATAIIKKVKELLSK